MKKALLITSLIALGIGSYFFIAKHHDVVRWYERYIVLNSPYLQKLEINNTKLAIEVLLKKREDKKGSKLQYGTIHVVNDSPFPKYAIALKELYPHSKIVISGTVNVPVSEAEKYLKEHNVPMGQFAFSSTPFNGSGDISADLLILPYGYYGEIPSNVPVLSQHMFFMNPSSGGSSSLGITQLSKLHLFEPAEKDQSTKKNQRCHQNEKSR